MAKANAAAQINKMAAVREAMESLGKDAKPVDIQGFIKEKHGVELSYGIVSNYKSTISKKAGTPRKSKRGRPRSPAKVAAASTIKTAAASNDSITVDDIQAVKQLADRIGADKVRKLAEVLR